MTTPALVPILTVGDLTAWPASDDTLDVQVHDGWLLATFYGEHREANALSFMTAYEQPREQEK